MNDKQKQWQLFFLDYYGESTQDIDGIFGLKSEAATLQFQKEFFPDPIAHDGIFGRNTAAKSMEVIDRIQDILKSVVPDLVDDGLAGPKTMEAMKLYQEAHLLPATGRVDDATWELLMLETPRQEAPEEPVPEQGTEDQTGGQGSCITDIHHRTQPVHAEAGGEGGNTAKQKADDQLLDHIG